MFRTDSQRITITHLLCLNRHHSSDGSLHKTDRLIKASHLLRIKKRFDHTLHYAAGIVEILTDDDIQCRTSDLPPPADTSDNIRDYQFKYADSDSRRHDVTCRYRLGNGGNIHTING